MIGFFEFQYLSFKKKSLGNLIAIARSDGHMDPQEEKLLYKLGNRYGLKDRQITIMINNSEPYELFIPETHGEKMDMFYDIMQLVFADSVVAVEEVDFCHHVAEKFGYAPEIVPWLLRAFSGGSVPDSVEWERMKVVAGREFLSEH